MNETALIPRRAGRREWIGLAVLALPCLLYAMDLTVLHLAVPQLSTALAPTSAELLWIIDIYGFLVAGSLITMGTLGDRIGRRRLLLIGAVLFGIASVLAAFSTSATMLIVTRALLGIAGATIAPSTLSLIRNLFLDPGQRTMAIGIWVTSFSLGSAIGPLVGGVLLEHFWWGSVFLLAVPVMIALLIVGPIFLPEYRDPTAGRLDLVSAVLSLGAVLAMIYGLKQLAQDGVTVPVLFAVPAGIALGVAFVRRQLTLADPFIDLGLFRVPGFSASLVTYGFSVMMSFGGFLFLSQYLQLVLGLSPLVSGIWMLPSTAAFIGGSLLAPALVRRFRPAQVIAGCLVLSAAGFALLLRIDTVSGPALFAIGSLAFSLGLSPVFTLATDLVVGAAPPERAGAAAAISETGAEFGGALGIAVFGSIGIAVYRSAMAGAIPAGVPADLAEAARNTLGGAVAAADQLPAQLGVPLVEAARQAFTQGIHLAGAISAVGSLLLAGLAFALLRRMSAGTDHGA